MIVLSYDEMTTVPINVNQYRTITGQTYYTFRLLSNDNEIIFTSNEITGNTRSSNFNITLSSTTNLTNGIINITNNNEYILYIYQTNISGNTSLSNCIPLKNNTIFNKNKDFLILQKVFINNVVQELKEKIYSSNLKIKTYHG